MLLAKRKKNFWQSKHRNKAYGWYDEQGRFVFLNEAIGTDFQARPLGYGLLPAKEIVKAAKEAGITHLIYENDPRGGNRFGLTPLEAAKSSCIYLKHCVAELEN